MDRDPRARTDHETEPANTPLDSLENKPQRHFRNGVRSRAHRAEPAEEEPLHVGWLQGQRPLEGTRVDPRQGQRAHTGLQNMGATGRKAGLPPPPSPAQLDSPFCPVSL